MTYTPRLSAGEIAYFSTIGTSISVPGVSDGSSNMVPVVVTTVFYGTSDMEQSSGANAGRIIYTGAMTRNFHVACTVSLSPAGVNDTFVMGLAKSGTVDADCKVLQKVTVAGDSQSTALHCFMPMSTNDYVSLYIGNMSSTSSMVIKTMNICAIGT